MARIRSIKPEFFRHEGLFDAEVETGLPLRVAFAGLWTACDREGRFRWKPRELKLDCLPFDEVDFSRVLDALRTRGHIVKYACHGVEFGFIPSWHDHQVINNRESASSLPEPPEKLDESTTSTRETRVDDASPTPLVHAQAEGKGREGKGEEEEEEGKGNEPPKASAPAPAASAPTASPSPAPRRRPKTEDPALVNAAAMVAEGVSADHAAQHLAVRKSKNLPLTGEAWKDMKTEGAEVGLPVAAMVAYCCKKSWASFKASWWRREEISSYRSWRVEVLSFF